MTDQQIYAVYEAGPAAVLTLVRGLLERLDQQQAQIITLTARVKALEDQRAQNSSNSSKPPSSDYVKPAPKSLRQVSGKLPGGQPGHRGDTLKMVAHPDQVVVHGLAQCQQCGGSLTHVQPEAWQRRQVFEVPAPRLVVTEHRIAHKSCPCCGRLNQGLFPASVSAPVQYGPRLKALALYLIDFQLLPYGRTSEFFADVFGHSISEGTLCEMTRTCYERLAEPEQQIKQALAAASVGHFDETGFYVEDSRRWLHVASTAQLTHYGWHEKRGHDATDALGILPVFAGVAIHDGWRSYRRYGCAHGLCNAHHVRELSFVAERYGQAWSTQMKALLLEIKQAVDEAKAAGAAALAALKRRRYRARYALILQEGIRANPPPVPGGKGRGKQSKAKNLLDRFNRWIRLARDGEEVLRFMEDFRVPFDNNQAERDLRMMKVKQKISGCFRSRAGASYFCRTRSYLSTMRKQGQGMLDALERVFTGDPISILIPE